MPSSSPQRPRGRLVADPLGPMPLRRKILRALARRLPRTRRAYDRGRHLAKRSIGAALRFWHVFPWAFRTWSEIAARRNEKRLTVGIDVTPFWEPLTGIGWYLYRLLEAAADREDIRLRLYGPTVVGNPDLAPPVVPLPTGPALERVLVDVPESLGPLLSPMVRVLRRLEPILLAADGNDVLFAPNYFLPRRFLLAEGARVATIHDLGLRKVPWTLGADTLRDLTARLEHAVFEASRLITVSAAVRDELSEYGYSAPERVHVIHHGPGNLARRVAEATSRLPEGLEPGFALFVGTLEPRKDIVTLLEAWRKVRSRRPDAPQLVLCGKFGWKTEAIEAAVSSAVEEGWLLHLGYVDDGTLDSLYRGAGLVAFPTLYEGFGLPAVEAQAAGVPLVASDLPVLREVAGDAALYVEPGRPDRFADEVLRLLDDPELAASLRRRGIENAARLDWSRAAEQTVAAWRRAAGRHPGDASGGSARRGGA